jgi:hypothetical protein
MYDSALRNAHQQVRRFTIRERGHGWEVVEQTENTIVKRLLLSDWHRVERAMATIKNEEAALQKRGWQKTA